MTASSLATLKRPEVETFHFKGAHVRRTITRRDGTVATSHVRTPEGIAAPSARDAHDLARLTASTRPVDALRTAGAVTVADMFPGCGGLSVGANEAPRALGLDAIEVLAVDTNESTPWQGNALSAPTIVKDEGLGPLNHRRCPTAAWGHHGRVFAVDATLSLYDSGVEVRTILSPPLKPLSIKAASGFVYRARRGKLRFAHGFLESIDDHIAGAA